MPASTSLYRKYRSQTFDELVGQEPVVRTLKNAISSGRVAHAYLFTGPRGVGKTTAARLLARAANCLSETSDRPCNVCDNCAAAVRDIATDLIEIDAASNTGVDNIRDVIERANFAPSVWNTKFYIIDEVHMLSVSAFNALLKTLEEPPPSTSFILATTEVHKVPATVASRCQRFDFRRIPLAAMVARMEFVCQTEGIEIETAGLEVVARHSTGSLRDALSLLDQLRVFADGKIKLGDVLDVLGSSGSEMVCDLVDSVIAGDMAKGLHEINRVLDDGHDVRQFNRQIVEHLRSLILVKSGAEAAELGLVDVTSEVRRRLIEQAKLVEMAGLLRWVENFAAADASIRTSALSQLPLEMALVGSILSQKQPELSHATIQPKDGVSPTAGNTAIRKTAAPRRAPQVSTELDREISPEGGETGMLPPVPQIEVADTAVVRDGLQPVAIEALPPAPEGQDDLQRLLETWPHVVDHIKARSPAIASVFRDPNLTKPFSVQNGLVTVSFRDPIHVARSKMEKQRDVIEQALTWVLGHPCRLESISFAEADAGGATTDNELKGERAGGTSANKEKPSPYGTTRGKAAINIFGITKFDE